MKETWQVVLAGEGGQGLIVAGILLAQAASLWEEKNAAQTQSYGIASRGGFTKSEVVISTREIIYPGVEEPDLVLALTQEAYGIYAPSLPAQAFLVYDSSLVEPLPEEKIAARACGFPFTETARELGRAEVTNLVALGAIVAITGIVGAESLEKTIRHRFSGRAAELNLQAYHRGLALAGSPINQLE
ncbi:MAG: 2-oxoacid:acceptor oxidoreductase family protein [Moorella sp. (in: Bacteria)]|nr:2-oxoacid:acceptor oxidoreductase family protein [Moorella sp. (in: firmicutes)]